MKTNIAQKISKADQLAYDYLEAKYKHDLAKKALDDAFDALMEIVPEKTEGTTNLDGDYYEIKTSFKVNYSVDIDEIQKHAHEIPQDVLDQVVVWKPSLCVKEYKDLKLSDSKQDNEYFKAIEKFVTKKPAKASIKVNELKKKETK